MKILVTIKQVPDTATQVKIAGDGKQIDTAGITWIVSPYDEFAVEEALRIKEKRGQGEVVAVSLGPDRVKEALRSALAMGCDRAIHVNDPALANADTLTTARVLAAVIKQEAPGLVLCGRQAIDDDMARSGPRSRKSSGGRARPGSWRRRSTATARRCGSAVRWRAGSRSSSCRCPRSSRAEGHQRAALPDAEEGIMGAKKKEIKDVTAADLGVTSVTPELSITALEALPARPPGRVVSGESKTP